MTRFKTARRAVGLAHVAGALLVSAAVPAQAQFYSFSGAVSTFPTEFFPINPAVSLFDFTGNTLFVGNSAAGSFSALAGAQLRGDALTVGGGGTGSGAVTVTGAGTSAQFGGLGNRLDIGSWGTGSLTVSAGAVVDAAVNAASCTTANSCNSFVGNGAGSTATLNITGAGSELSAMRYFIVGQAAVFTQANDGFTFGTPGGTTTAFVNVLDGAALRTQEARVGVGPNTPSATGTERGIATVVIDGPGSRWIATTNSVDNTQASFGAGVGVGGQATIDIRNGGKLIVDGTGGNPTTFDVINLGASGGRADMTVSGVGSSVEVKGNNPVLQVGRSGVGGQGSFSVLAGATASSMFLNVGRDSASGTVLIDGAGSQMNLIGVGTPGTAGAAFASIGRDGGSGQVTVSNGGHWLISDGGADSRPGNGSPGVAIGRGVGGTGALTITGAGSVLEIVSTSLGLPAGAPDNFNPFMAVGYDNPTTATGQLTVSNGGKLLLTGNAVSTVTDQRGTSLNIGGRSSASGTGVATVTGAGSEIVISGNAAFIGVGRGTGSNGTLNVLDQGRVATTNMVVGENASGTLNVNNASIAFSGFRLDTNPTTGSGMTVGRGTGSNGAMTLANGSLLTIDNNTLAGGMSIGGDSFVSGGSGAVALSGASSILFTGSVTGGALSVGRTGTGTMSLADASIVDVGNTRSVYVGRNAGGSGSLSVSGGSRVSSGVIGIGGDSDTTAGGIGSAAVTGLGSLLSATGDNGFISVGRSGTGALAISNQGTLAATVLNVGRATGGQGNLIADNGIINLSGQQSSGIGAAFSIGNRGGSGAATINNSQVTISNQGSGGASLNIGGTPVNPLGTGTLNVTGGSQINVLAAPGLATVRIGHDGSGSASFAASSLNIGDGSLLIAGLTGSTGTMTMSTGSVVNAGYVGVGATSAGAGGAGRLVLDNSTINTTTFEIGAQGVLTGNGGVINATGDVLVAGLISPGDSPGRININCNLITLPGSMLVLEVSDTGDGFNVDHLILGNDSTFDLSNVAVVFSFLGNTDPNAFAASGGFDLDNFLQSLDLATGEVSGLSSVFAAGETWNDVFSASQFSATSDAFDITNLNFTPDGSVTATATPVPEPGTWALMLTGLFIVAGIARRRSASSTR